MNLGRPESFTVDGYDGKRGYVDGKEFRAYIVSGIPFGLIDKEEYMSTGKLPPYLLVIGDHLAGSDSVRAYTVTDPVAIRKITNIALSRSYPELNLETDDTYETLLSKLGKWDLTTDEDMRDIIGLFRI